MSKNLKKNIQRTLYNHITNNKREYFILIILFFIGVFISVFFINNASNIQKEEIEAYMNDFFNIDSYSNINYFLVYIQSIKSNLILVLILWISSILIIGVPLIYIIPIIKGFTIGYSIGSIIYFWGTNNITTYLTLLLFLNNLIVLPVIFAVSVKGIYLYKNIFKIKDRKNIILEIIKYTIFCLCMSSILLIEAFIKAFFITRIFFTLLKYIKF